MESQRNVAYIIKKKKTQ